MNATESKQAPPAPHPTSTLPGCCLQAHHRTHPDARQTWFALSAALLASIALPVTAAGPGQTAGDFWPPRVVDALKVGLQNPDSRHLTWPAVCVAMSQFRANLKSTPLYARRNTACVPADAAAKQTHNLYADSSCSLPITFQKDNPVALCKEFFFGDPNPYIGNPKLWTELGYLPDTHDSLPSTAWTVASAAKYQLSAESVVGKSAPYLKRVLFREINGCQLEMRVYKKNLSAGGLKPLLFLHGGSWYRRAMGALGVEASVAHYTEDGFIVFAPFYRLSHAGKDGPAECQDASWSDISDDVEAALDWLQRNGTHYGAATVPVAVVGQSAGGFLAAWLVTHRYTDIDRALLLYPAADVLDFVERLNPRDGQRNTAFSSIPYNELGNFDPMPYEPRKAVSALYKLLDPPRKRNEDKRLAFTRLIDHSPLPASISENSFAHIIAGNPQLYPPVFILHGASDRVIHVSQAKMLCNAYGGTVTDTDGSIAPRSIFSCGRSQLHLFAKVDHVFDLCPPQDTYNFGVDLCRSGDAASKAMIVESLVTARQWLQGDATTTLRGTQDQNAAPPMVWQKRAGGQTAALQPVTARSFAP